ncbi:hypothetical protein ACIHFD_66365 [Nonomuraea sp. NPDC051941]|uniref:hypothetical protein n=1 Tax=Nonomuraea sp. NPDC051941 TaxID=3364373 RepID=UPI0037C67F1C
MISAASDPENLAGAVLLRTTGFYGDDGPYGHLPRVPHGKQVRDFADGWREHTPAAGG